MKRRSFTEAQKRAIIAEAEQAGLTPTARKHGLTAPLIIRWRRRVELLDLAHSAAGMNYELAQIWLHLRDAGGWWSAQELLEHWHPTFPVLTVLEAKIRTLLNHGAIEQRHSFEHPGLAVYGVTSKCEPLPSYTLEPSNTQGTAAC